MGYFSVAQYHLKQDQGLGGWTDAEIKRAITQGVDKDGKKLDPPMGFSYYAHMKDCRP